MRQIDGSGSLVRLALLPLTVIGLACEAAERPDRGVAQDTAVNGGAAGGPRSIADVGLSTPESVLYDDRADVYLVSNINGGPAAKDDNGFIARLRPDGTVEQLKWIDGASDAVTLHAPKGMAFHGDTLFVSDIDSVRAFHRSTGAPLGARGVPNAAFLNDLAVGDDGTLYVTDMGVDSTFTSIGREAVYRFEAGGARAIARGAAVPGPNGIVVREGQAYVVPFNGDVVYRIATGGGSPVRMATLPAGGLDGIVRLADGTLLVSSWEGQAVYRVAPDGTVGTVVEGVESPADIGYDTRRGRLLIPLFMGNRIEIRDVR